jgi:hypothetical protein
LATEIILLALIYTVGHWIWRNQVALEAAWYGTPEGVRHINLTLAGYWNLFVSVPIFQFLLARWYLRMFIWFWFLLRVARLDLQLEPAHPDRAGGLLFLGNSTYAFGPVLFAEGALLAGTIGRRVLHGGQSIFSFKMTIAGYIAFFVVGVLAPLTLFAPNMVRAKRQGLAEYGALATIYTRRFGEKWLRGGADNEELLGASDIQSLADLSNSFSVVREMRLVPFGFEHMALLAGATALPVLPLLLTIMPFEELVTRILKIIF